MVSSSNNKQQADADTEVVVENGNIDVGRAMNQMGIECYKDIKWTMMTLMPASIAAY